MRAEDLCGGTPAAITAARDLADALPRTPLLRTGTYARSACPACGGRRLVRWGVFSGRQRQRCRDCRRTFSDFTGTWLAHGKRPADWCEFIECMRLGLSVRAAGRRVGVHKDTAWRWRHRLLAEHLRLGWPELAGTLETTERMTLVNQKGERGLPPMGHTHRCRFISHRPRAWLLITRDREEHVFAVVMRSVQPTRTDLEEVLAPRCQRVRWLLAKRPIYAWFAASHGARFAHRAHVFDDTSPFSIKQLYAYDRRMRAWLARFYGVATRYLDRYLRWYALVDQPPDGPTVAPLTAPGSASPGRR